MGSIAVLIILTLIATAYIVRAPSALTVSAVLLATAVLGAAAPAVAVAATIGLAPVIDGVMALLRGVSPVPPWTGGLAWIEPVFLGATSGIVARRLWCRNATSGGSTVARFYVLAQLWVLAVVVIQHVGGWHSRSPYALFLMWTGVPDVAQGAPEHVLRAALLLLAVPLWLDAVAGSVRAHADLRRIRIAWLLGAMAAALVGQWMWMRGLGQVPPRAESWFDDVNSYGSYLVLSLFMAVAVWVDDRRRAARVLAGLSLAATVWMLILCGSRMAFLAALGAMAVAALLNLSKRRLRTAAIVALPVLALVAVVNLPLRGTTAETIERSQVLRLVRNATVPSHLAAYFVEMRLAVWSAAGRAFVEHPLTGIGPGRLYTSLGDYYRPGDPGWRPPNENAHNYFLQLAAETGIVGVVAFGWLLTAALLAALRDPAGGLAGRRVLALAALGYLATCVSGHPLLISRQIVLFWGFVGLLVVSTPGAEPPQLPAGVVSRWSAWAIAPVLMAAVLMGLPRRTCPAGHDGIGVDYGLGFYAAEAGATGAWRWMRDAGELRLCNATAATLVAAISLPVTSFHSPRALEAGSGDRFLIDQTVTPGSVQTLEMTSISLAPGWTTLSMVSTSGGERVDSILHNGDPRSVSVRVGPPSVSVQACSRGQQVTATFGPGFYTAESDAGGTWRWMRKTGELLLCNGTASTVVTDLTVPATSFHSPRTLSAYRDARRVEQFTVPAGPTVMLTLPSLTLPPGWTTVSLEPHQSPEVIDQVAHSGDRRLVSIRVGSPSLVVRPAR